MKKLFLITLIILCLFVVEALLFSIIAFVERAFSQGRFFHEQDFRFILGLMWMRTLLYFLPQLLVFYLGLNFVKEKGWWALSLLNVGVFALITVSVLGIWTNDLAEYVRRPIFYGFIIVTALSPFLLNLLPFFRKILERI